MFSPWGLHTLSHLIPPRKYDRYQLNLDPEEQLRLLQDPSFRLLMVPPCGITQSLTVVTPASDPSIAEDVKQLGWFCLSLMWGNPSEWIDWDDAGVVDHATRDFITPKVHPSKREEIMRLIESKPGYWWIDIFCAQSDTPLVIMGDIYKGCNICFALIDSPYETFDEGQRSATNLIMACEDHPEEAAYGYLEMISKRDHDETRSTEWVQVLNDLVHWPSQHLHDAADDFLQREKNRYREGSKMVQFFNTLLELPISERSKAADRFFDIKYDRRRFGDYNREGLMSNLQRYSLGCVNEAKQGLADFLNCGWMSRVWTLQELALPKEVRMLFSELQPLLDSFAVFWQIHLIQFLKVIMKAYEIREKASMVTQPNQNHEKMVRTPRQILEHYQRTDPVLAQIYSDYRKLLGAVISVAYTSSTRAKEEVDDDLARRFILNSFATSQRKAHFPVDYVYGVLGILDIDIPRLDDPKDVWSVFSKKLRERYSDIYVPDDVNLAEATKMEDVYGQLGFTRENEISHDIVEYLTITAKNFSIKNRQKSSNPVIPVNNRGNLLVMTGTSTSVKTLSSIQTSTPRIYECVYFSIVCVFLSISGQ